MPSFTQSGYLCEFKSTWETMIEKWHAKTILSFKHYLLHVETVSEKTKKAFVLCNLIQEEVNYGDLASISILLLPIRTNNTEFDKKIGSVNYNDLPDKFQQLSSRQYSDYYSLTAGYYLLVPLASNNKGTLQNLNYIMRILSNDQIRVEELVCEDESKFSTIDERFINIIVKRCNFCERLIEAKYTSTDNFMYHQECYNLLNVCDYCSNRIETSFYTMNQSLKCCTKCYSYIQDRVNSAKVK